MCSSSSLTPVAIILSGNGVYDGSEITEAVATLVAAHKAGLAPTVYAPDIQQAHVVNHITGEEMPGEQRNVLVEAARIARGNVTDLSQLDPTKYAGLIVPGGFGAAKNLSSFAFDGPDCSVQSDVAAALSGFHAVGKPIALCCIAPVLAAKVLPGVHVTVGSATESDTWPFAGAAAGVDAMGGHHVERDVDDVQVDERNKIVTAPAYMKATTPDAVFDSVQGMVQRFAQML